MGQTIAEAVGTRGGLGECLTLERAGDLKRQFLERLAEPGDLVLDAQAVRAVDAAGLQLLCAVHRSALAAGKQLVLRGVGEALYAALRLSGLAGARGCGAGCPWQQTGRDG